jgi:hypothetical protein
MIFNQLVSFKTDISDWGDNRTRLIMGPPIITAVMFRSWQYVGFIKLNNFHYS